MDGGMNIYEKEVQFTKGKIEKLTRKWVDLELGILFG